MDSVTPPSTVPTSTGYPNLHPGTTPWQNFSPKEDRCKVFCKTNTFPPVLLLNPSFQHSVQDALGTPELMGTEADSCPSQPKKAFSYHRSL